MSNRLIESDNGWSVALINARVGYIHVDFRVGIDICDATNTVSIVIETPFQLRSTAGEATVVPDDVATVAPILKLFNVGLDDIAIDLNGELALRFSNGDQLNVSASDKYEAWQIACVNEFLIVCQPGGAVSIFQESSPEV